MGILDIEERQRESFFVAFDTETTGAYPIGWEICEIAGVKWRDGQIQETFAQLIRPRGPIHPVSHQIHGLSSKDLDHQPYAEEALPQFLDFIEDATLIAHHAPFDMGFLSYDLERYGLYLPTNKVICTSLLSQALFPKSPNYKLQTLMEYLHLQKQYPPHRSLSDAKACLLVALECLKKIKPLTMNQINSCMKTELTWEYFSIKKLEGQPEMQILIKAILEKQKIRFVYLRGSRPGASREILPIGLVKNPKGDFLVAEDQPLGQTKRFYLDFVKNIHLKT